MKQVNLKSQIEIWSQMISKGDGKKVSQEIASFLQKNEVPFEDLKSFSGLSWRIGQPKLGIKILSPYLKKCRDLRQKPAPEIITEYTGCLLQLGAHQEALRTLYSMNTEKIGRALFLQSLALFRDWNYRDAVPLLTKYYESLDPTYEKKIVGVNLASALLGSENLNECANLLQLLKPELAETKSTLLLGNCLEIESQIYFERGQFDHALLLLSESESYLKNSQNVGYLFCKKWQWINTCARDVIHSHDENKLSKIQFPTDLVMMAQNLKHWETLREIDLFWGVFKKDKNLLKHTYFGSPIKRYRSRILKILDIFYKDHNLHFKKRSETVSFLNRSYLNLPQDVKTDLQTFDIGSILMDFQLKGFTDLMRLCLLKLLKERYTPLRVGQLFSQLWPEEHFDLTTSPDKVFQIIKRLKYFLKSQKIPVSILTVNDGYFLSFNTEFKLLMNTDLLNDDLDSINDLIFLKIEHAFMHQDIFRNSEVAKLLNVSLRSSQRYLLRLEQTHKIERGGMGKHTYYKIKKPSHIEPMDTSRESKRAS